jgi:predicted methyltransferase
MKTLLTSTLATLAFTLIACQQQEPPDANPKAARASELAELRLKLASGDRPVADQERDAGRKPADVIEFLGIQPGMRVIDVIAAGGYYTEVLSHAVGPTGAVVAQNTDRVLQFRDGANEAAISARLAGNRLPNVTRLNRNFEAIDGSDGLFDAGITALNFHDIYNGAGADAAVSMMRTIYSVLRPGAVFGVIDHVGIAGADNIQLHRIEVRKAIDTAEAAGFIVEAQSDLLHNPADDHSQGVFADSVRRNTDRFILKLRKPAV